MTEKKNSQVRIFEIVQCLRNNHVHGLTNKELAALVQAGESTICRDMELMERYQWAARTRELRWRLSPTFGGIAGHIMRSYQDARLRLTEEEAQYASAMQ
jgi:predicted DNA-binding transcriptional regulator YafY